MSAGFEKRSFAVGSAIGTDLTVLGVIDDGGGDHAPVYIVWNHRAWCAMACKVFRSRRRAEEEASLIAALAHPNIVRCFGVGSRPAHLLMEFLEGPTAKAVAKAQPRSRLALAEAMRIAIHIGAALVHMHGRGILHLDLKPSNIIVTPVGRPVLFDLGTARARPDWALACVEGTDPYMAPEQCRREDAVTPATDVFGFGVTLYQLLTSELPFPRGTRRQPFPQLSVDPVPARRHRPSLPAALDRLLLRCLARDPAGRPASLTEILPLLHEFIRSGPRMWPADFRPDDETRHSREAAPAVRRPLPLPANAPRLQA